MNSKSCLLIMRRSFHSFEKILKDALISKGFTVEVSNDEYPAGIIGKIMGKIQLPLIFPLTYNYIKKHYLINNQYDLALIIGGRGLSIRLIKEMRGSIPNIIGYNWDTFDSNKSPLKWFKYVNKYYTFDYSDSDRFSIPCLELFSSSPLDLEVKVVKYEISAVGKNYADRLLYIDKVLKILKPSQAFIYLYENNIFDLLKNFLKNPILYFKFKNNIHFHPLKDIDYLNAIKFSEFTIDYAHKDQTGITMRCFESISLKTRIITNNHYLNRSCYFNDSNCIIFSPSDEPKELISNYITCKTSDFILKVRDIHCFIDELIA